MPLRVKCPQCGASLTAPEHFAGKKTKCPKCKTAVALPAPADDEPIVTVEHLDENQLSANQSSLVKDSKICGEDEGDAEERPYRKGKQAAGVSRLVLGLAIGGGALILIVGMVIGAALMGGRGADDKQVSTNRQSAGNNLPNNAPGKPAPNAETEESKRKSEAEAARKQEEKRRAEARDKSAARLANLKAKLATAEQEAAEANQQLLDARAEADQVEAKRDTAERNYRSAQMSQSRLTSKASNAAKIDANKEVLRESGNMAQATKAAQASKEIVRQAEAKALQATTALAEARADFRQAESDAVRANLDSPLKAEPKSGSKASEARAQETQAQVKKVESGSAGAFERIQEFRDNTQKQAATAAGARKVTANALQELRDEVIAAGAVAKYAMKKDGASEADIEAVQEFVGRGRLPSLEALDQERVIRLLDEKEEVKAWIKAEIEYTTATARTK